MDPASAIGIAAASVAFLDFSLKTMSVCRELLDSTTGALPENLDIERRAKTLQRITKDLNTSTSASSAADKRIIDIGKKCILLSGDLQELLNKIKPNGKSISQTLKSALRSIRDKRTIEVMEKTLHKYQNILDTTVLVDIRERVDIVAFQQTKSFASMRKDYQSIVLNLAKNAENNAAEQVKTRSDLTLRIKESQASVSETIAREHADTRAQHEAVTQRMRDSIELAARNKAVLDSLFFPEYKARQEQVEEAYERTFRWIFDNAEGALGGWDNFASWIREGDDVYWIQGKAGAGKSTLMSFILSEEQTATKLQEWAGSKKLVCLSFYFWRPGSDLQKSTTGLLRSLVYQLLEADKEIICQATNFGSSTNIPTWTEKTLRATFFQVLHATAYKVCIFIDGLDEFQGETDKLLDLCIECASLPGVKLCVSSRPELALKRRLQACKTLRLQDLTRQDMESFVKGRLEDTKGLEDLMEEIVDRADGIFLWTALVTRSLLEGYNCHDDENTLRQRLEQFPKGLDPLYAHMLDSIDTFHQEKSRIYFLMANLPRRKIFPTRELTVATLTIASDETMTKVLEADTFKIIDIKHFVRRCQVTEDRIQIYCKGFLELRFQDPPVFDSYSSSLDSDFDDSDFDGSNFDNNNRSGSHRKSHPPLSTTPLQDQLAIYDNTNVEFTHRTAYDFIFDTEVGCGFMSASTLLERDLEIDFVQGLIGGFLLIPRIRAPYKNQYGDIHTRFNEAIEAASSVQELFPRRDVLLDQFFRNISSLRGYEPYTKFILKLEQTWAGENLQVGFFAHCVQWMPWMLSDYICAKLQLETQPNALLDAALLQASSLNSIDLTDTPKIEWIKWFDLFLTRLEAQLPANIAERIEPHRSELRWLSNYIPDALLAQSIDYTAAGHDPSIGKCLAKTLSLISVASSNLIACSLHHGRLFPRTPKPEVKYSLDPFLHIINRFGDLVPDGHVWIRVLYGIVKIFTTDGQMSRQWFNIFAHAGVILSHLPRGPNEDIRWPLKNSCDRYIVQYSKSRGSSSEEPKYILTCHETDKLEKLLQQAINVCGSRIGPSINLPLDFAYLALEVFMSEPDPRDDIVAFFQEFVNLAEKAEVDGETRLLFYPETFSFMLDDVSDPKTSSSSPRNLVTLSTTIGHVEDST